MFPFVLILMAAGVLNPIQQSLIAPYPVWDAIVEDINNDGQPDIIGLCKPEEPSIRVKYLVVFLSKGNGRFNSTPDVEFVLTAESGIGLIGNFLEAKKNVLLMTNPEGCVFLEYQDGEFVPVGEAKFRTLMPSYTLKPKFVRNAVVDVDEDGIDEWILPTPGGQIIQNAKGFSSFIEGDNTSELIDVGGLSVIHRLPNVHVYGERDSELKSIALLSERRVDWYWGKEWEEHGEFEIPLRLKENWEARTKLADVNGDEHPDLMVTQTKGTIDLSTMVQIYISDDSLRYNSVPTFQTTFKGGVATPALFDVDGDEDLDLVMINIPFSFKNLANFFLRKKMSVRIDIHFFDKNSFSKSPDYKQYFTLDAPDGQERVGYALGDFSGDGRTDVAISHQRNLISIYTGQKKRLLSPKPTYQFTLPAFGVLTREDINLSGGEDLLLFHSVGKHKRQIDVICF
jgi:hypothetical protein